MTADLSVAQARRIALAAQGFADAAPTGTVTRTHLKRAVARTKLIQMDSVNVLARAHYLPLFSRLGAYDESLLNAAAWRDSARSPRLLVEYWAHEAALIPVEDWPLFRWRMRELAQGRWGYTREISRRGGSLAGDLRDVIVERGPSTPRELEDALNIERPAAHKGSWWVRGEVKHLCEAMFAAGELSSIRDDHFIRRYDLAERVLPAGATEIDVPEADAVRELIRRAAAAHGIGTVRDFADYYRLRTAQVTPILGDLLDDGALIKTTVEGWDEPAYLHAGARTPRRIARSALLSPFDPVVFYRPRTERLFDFHYRIEIYVPAHKRVHGYYVLPYLVDGNLVGRVDLKADRKSGVLQVLSAHHEPEVDRALVADRLAADLRDLADWRGLERIDVARQGNLADVLGARVGGTR